MCDYSLESVASRPAKVGDRLVSSNFSGSPTRGFAVVGELHVAVCLLPGTELAFDQEVVCERLFGFLSSRISSQTVARFRHINEHRPLTHHDALEFADGSTVLLTRLRLGQRATVLQLPATARAKAETHPTENERERIALF
jgi:hypothetical protein